MFSLSAFCALVTMAVVGKLLSILTGVKNKIKLFSRMLCVLLANVAIAKSNDTFKAIIEWANR